MQWRLGRASSPVTRPPSCARGQRGVCRQQGEHDERPSVHWGSSGRSLSALSGTECLPFPPASEAHGSSRAEGGKVGPAPEGRQVRAQLPPVLDENLPPPWRGSTVVPWEGAGGRARRSLQREDHLHPGLQQSSPRVLCAGPSLGSDLTERRWCLSTGCLRTVRIVDPMRTCEAPGTHTCAGRHIPSWSPCERYERLFLC